MAGCYGLECLGKGDVSSMSVLYKKNVAIAVMDVETTVNGVVIVNLDGGFAVCVADYTGSGVHCKSYSNINEFLREEGCKRYINIGSIIINKTHIANIADMLLTMLHDYDPCITTSRNNTKNDEEEVRQ